MFEAVLKNEQLRQAAGLLAPGKTLRISGVWGSSAALAAAAMGRLAGKTILFVTSHLDDADDVADDVEIFTGQAAELFPAWEVDVGMDHVNDEVAGERLRLCNILAEALGSPKTGGKPPRESPQCAGPAFIVAPVMALLQPVPSPRALAAGRLALCKGGQFDPDQLAAWLTDAGFDRVDQVDQQGEYARRGGIIDVFPSGAPQALRVEFFGDKIESIRRFDLDTQRSAAELDACDVPSIALGRAIDAQDVATLLDYLPPDAVVCIIEPTEVIDLARELHRRLSESAGGLRLWNPDEVLLGLSRFSLVEMRSFGGQAKESGVAEVNLGVRSLERLALETREALGELTAMSSSTQVWVYCENQTQEQHFRDMLAAEHPALAAAARTAIGHVKSGFHWPSQHLAVVGHHELFHRHVKVRHMRRIRAGRPIESLLDLQEGDYVVHVAHGIAKFEGLRTLIRDGRSEEYLRLRFADSAVLHVPASGINLVQKYVGARGKRPGLSHLGGGGWLKTKQRVEAAVTDLAAELLRIQAMRRSMQGLSYPLTTDWQRQFEDEFLYEETEDQLTSMRQIDDDMFRPRPMDRLLCGDVGYGKTELAMRAAFKVVQAGRQVAVLVPTTVLADQHYRTFSERFADYPVRIDVVSRFRTKGQQAQVLKNLALGKIDILIGTHRLLSRDVAFADLGLAVIDEEQRFGVKHKERLKAMRAAVDVLTMTATPIPRTMHMTLLGLRDISSLSTPPLDRRAIHTEVRHYDDQFVRQAVLRELNRQGQVFFVHNRVMDIETLASRVVGLVPEARVEVAHGQMPEGRLEKVMMRFVNRHADVLVCTTIVESGLDIPTANTIIIHNADRFGLAELHQLRGRVGRSEHRAFCYLLLPESRPVSAVAAKRLKAIEEFSDLGAGFQIAMRDLEIRGAGNILGPQQSGHIAAVGYELYCRLLEKAVRQTQGRPEPVHHEVHVELGVDALLPKTYVASERQRMEVYRRLAACCSREELRQLEADLADAYGPPPPAATTLLELAEIRVLAGQRGIDSIIRMEPDIIFDIRDFAAAKGVFEGVQGSVRLPDERTAHWRPPAYLQTQTLMRVLLKRLR